MTLKQRRWLYLGLIIIFFISAPLFIIYSFGFRYNFQQQKLQKTGALYLRTHPSGAEIILNNKSIGINTPNKITNLLPGDYQIGLQKNDYFPWQKRLRIQSSLTTFAEDVYLFKNQLTPELLTNGQINNFSVSPTRKKIIYTVNQGKIKNTFLFYFDSFKSEQIDVTLDLKNFNNWPNNEEKILFQDKINHYFILDFANYNKLINIWQKNNLNFSFLTWDDQNSNILWGLVNQKLYKIDLLANQPEKISTPKIINLLPTNEGFYFIYQKATAFNLTIALAKFKKFEEIKEIGELPINKNYQLDKIKDWLFIYNPEDKTLYFLKYNNQKPILYNVLKSVNGYALKNNNLLYWNDFEYFIYNLENQNNQLIERLSTPIFQIFWHPEANYLLVETANSLKIIEIDDRDQKNSYELIKPKQLIMDKITFSPNTEIIVFATKIAEEEGLFYLNLQ